MALLLCTLVLNTLPFIYAPLETITSGTVFSVRALRQKAIFRAERKIKIDERVMKAYGSLQSLASGELPFKARRVLSVRGLPHLALISLFISSSVKYHFGFPRYDV